MSTLGVLVWLAGARRLLSMALLLLSAWLVVVGACSDESGPSAVSEPTPRSPAEASPTAPPGTASPPAPSASETGKPPPDAATPIPSATPSALPPIPTRVPPPARTVTPTPTATPPEPAVYSIEAFEVELVGGGNGTVTAKFDVSITNVGGSGGHDAVSLSMAIDGQEPLAMAIVPRPPEGSEVEFNVTAWSLRFSQSW